MNAGMCNKISTTKTEESTLKNKTKVLRGVKIAEINKTDGKMLNYLRFEHYLNVESNRILGLNIKIVRQMKLAKVEDTGTICRKCLKIVS